MEERTPLEAAIAHIGSQQAFADLLGVKPPSVAEWRKRGRPPAERCIAIEDATGGQITRYALRPDVFGAAPPATVADFSEPDPDADRVVPVEGA
jgi:DNA-binding transcriptional regulator YdaS (Cro superfamily)